MYPMEGWEIHMNQVKNVKEAYPVNLAEYAVQNIISEQPAFAWWIKYVLKKRDRILSKTTSKYWQKTHRYGVRMPKSVKEAFQIDK